MDIRERIKNVMIAALDEVTNPGTKETPLPLAQIHGMGVTKNTDPVKAHLDRSRFSQKTRGAAGGAFKPVKTNQPGHQEVRTKRASNTRPGKRSVTDVAADIAEKHKSEGGSGNLSKDLPPKDPSIGDH